MPDELREDEPSDDEEAFESTRLRLSAEKNKDSNISSPQKPIAVPPTLPVHIDHHSIEEINPTIRQLMEVYFEVPKLE
jgi:hypothetical protein